MAWLLSQDATKSFLMIAGNRFAEVYKRVGTVAGRNDEMSLGTL